MFTTMRLTTLVGVGLLVAAGLGLVAAVTPASDKPADETQAQRANQPTQPAGEPAETKALQIELPQPKFDCTPVDLPRDIRVDPERRKRVQRRDRQREPVKAPVGTRLVSRDKPVTMSADWSIMGEPALVTDGDKSPAPGSFLEMSPGKQWAQIDLKDRFAIHVIAIWHYHVQPRVYRDVVVQVSNDKDFEKNVTTVFNNDADNSLGLGKGDDFEYIENHEGRALELDGVTGRYVRLYSRGNTANRQNHYTEVEVYGQPANHFAGGDPSGPCHFPGCGYHGQAKGRHGEPHTGHGHASVAMAPANRLHSSLKH